LIVYNFTFGLEALGMSAFYKGARGDILHTYLTSGHGLEGFLAVLVFLDLVPKGRGKEGWLQSTARVRAA
jgi:predicted dithiol-disulfide oxidoreductase (DUF899 family)